MKLNKMTLLVLVASTVAMGCNKRPTGPKAEEKPAPDIHAVTAPETPAHTGALSIAVSEKYAALMSAYNKEADKDTLKLTAAYAPTSKKLTISKDHSSLKIVAMDASGKAAPVDLKTITKAPVMTLGEKALAIEADEAKKQYVLKSDSDVDADPSKAVTITIKGEDEKAKIAETQYELSPVVLLGKADEQSQELVLDLSKGEVPSDIAFVSSYAGAEGDPTKPECAMISANGIGAVKPITIGLDISNQDHVIDLSSQKAALAKLPAGETTFEIVCIREDASKKPSLIAITTTVGFTLKVIQPEVKKEEPKKEEEAKK